MLKKECQGDMNRVLNCVSCHQDTEDNGVNIMAQKKWETLLADQFEGGVSTERALLDIKRGLMENLYHGANQ